MALSGISAGYHQAMSEPLPSGSLAGADLTGRDLSGASLAGRDLSGSDLAQADLGDANLSGANLSGANLRGARLVHVDLTGATLDGANLKGADLSGATLTQTSMVLVTLKDATADHTAWRQTQAEGGDWSSVDLTGAVFERVKLQDVSLAGATLDELHLTDTDVERSQLNDASASRLTIVDTSFVDVDASGAQLRDASFRFADFKRVTLTGAALDGSTFESVDFRGTHFDEVSAAGARLERCAGLDRAAKRLLEDAGAALPVPLLGRLAAAITGSSTATRLAVLLVVGVAVGLYAWMSVKKVNPGMHEVGPEELLGEDQVAWQALERRYDSEPEARMLILQEMAQFLDGLGAVAAAETKLREALEIAERNEEVPPLPTLLGLSDFLLAHERFDDALSYARELDQPGAGKRGVAVSRLIIARTLLARGNTERATEVARELVLQIAEVPDEVARFRLGMAAVAIVEEVSGPAAALPLLDASPPSLGLEEQGEVALERAALLARMGHIGEAVRGFDATMIAYSDLPLIRERAREERARLLKMGSDPEAEERRLRELAAGDDLLAAQSALGLARLSVRRGAVDEAISRYQDVRVRHGKQVETRVEASIELAELLASTGDVTGAEALLREEVVELVDQPERGLVLRQALVESRYQAGDMDGALAEARRTVTWAKADESLSLRAQLQLAGLADEAGKFDEAIDLYKAVALAAQDPGLVAAAWFGQATLMRRRGAPEAAIPLMDSALMHLPPQHAFRGAIVVERAEVLAELGKSSPAAVEQMLAEARAAGLDENQPVAYASLLLMLGRELAGAERHEDALNVYQQVAASSAGGEEPGLRQQAVQGQVEALVALGRQDQAAALLDNTSLDGLTSGGADETCDALHGLAIARAEAGEMDAAIDGFDKVFETCRSPRFLVAHLPPISDLLVEAGRSEAATGLLQSIIEAPAVPEEGKQAAALELGRLGSVAALDQAADGPDEALAALARIEIASRLEAAGEVDQARAILRGIAEDTDAEAFPRGLAQLGLGRLAAAAGDKGGARVWLVQARDAGDPWLRDQASQALTGLDGPDGS